MDEEMVVELLASLLKQVSESAVGADELVALWMNIGKKMGVNLYLPEMRAVALTDEVTGERHLVAFVATMSEELTEYLTSEDVFYEEVVTSCLSTKAEEIGH